MRKGTVQASRSRQPYVRQGRVSGHPKGVTGTWWFPVTFETWAMSSRSCFPSLSRSCGTGTLSGRPLLSSRFSSGLLFIIAGVFRWNTTCGSNNRTSPVVEGCTCRGMCFLLFTPVCWWKCCPFFCILLSANCEDRKLRKSQWSACAGRRRVTPGTAS